MDYVQENYFNDIDKIKSKKSKVRRALTIPELKTLIEWGTNNNPQYLAMYILCYYCLLRPDDIIKLRIKDFDFKLQLIFIGAERTKNKHDSFRVIPEALETYLKYIDFNNNELLIFSKHFTPGPEMLNPREISRYWAKTIRPACGFGMDLQFYSLKILE